MPYKSLNRTKILESSRGMSLAYNGLSNSGNPTSVIGDPLREVQCDNNKLIGWLKEHI